MTYLAGGPIQQVARVTVENAATTGQVNIPVPGGFVPGMTDVYIGGACLSQGDYDDSDGAQIKLRNGMASGTQYRVVAFGAYTNQQPVSGQLAGFRNRIINGGCRVAQRPSYQQNGAFAGKAFAGPDRFQIVTIGTPGGTVTQSAGTIGFQGIARPATFQTVNSVATSISGSNAWSGFQYVIEGFDAYDLLGNPVSISFIFATATTGLYSVCLRDYTGTQSCISQFMATAGVPVKMIVPIPSLPLNLSVPASNDGGLTLTIGALNMGQFQTTNPLGAWGPSGFLTAAGNVNWINAANNFIAIAELQLEPGNVATIFERRPISIELPLCQRYFETGVQCSVGYSTASGYAASSQQQMRYSVTKRVNPTVVFNRQSQAGVATADPTQLAFSSSWPDGCVPFYNMSSAGNYNLVDNWTSSAEL
jgi:hypothetical protein